MSLASRKQPLNALMGLIFLICFFLFWIPNSSFTCSFTAGTFVSKWEFRAANRTYAPVINTKLAGVVLYLGVSCFGVRLCHVYVTLAYKQLQLFLLLNDQCFVLLLSGSSLSLGITAHPHPRPRGQGPYLVTLAYTVPAVSYTNHSAIFDSRWL